MIAGPAVVRSHLSRLAAVLAAIILVTSLAACGPAPAPPPTTWSPPSAMATSNQPVPGRQISITTTAGWTEMNASTYGDDAYVCQNPDIMGTLVVTVLRPPAGQDAGTVLQSLHEQAENNQVPGGTVTDIIPAPVGSYEGWTFTADNPGTNVMRYWMTDLAGTLYQFTCNTVGDQWPSVEGDCASMVDSFKLV